LPKDWINLTGVMHGDIVYLDQGKDNTLRILSENLVKEMNKPTEYHINCDLAQEPNLLERLVVGGYMQGADTIKVFSSTRIDGKQMEEVRNIVRRLVGFSIMEMSRNEIILQCAIDPLKFKIYSLIKRLSVTATTMLDEAMEALHNFNPELANDVIKREDEANNIYWLITRLLLSTQKSPPLAEKIGLNEYQPLTDIRLVSKNLERIADCSESIAKIALDLHRIIDTIDKKELEKMLPLDQLTKEVFQKAVDSLFSRDIITANDALNLRIELDAEVEARMRRAAIPYFRAIAIMLAMIAENSASIATVAINIEIGRRLAHLQSSQEG